LKKVCGIENYDIYGIMDGHGSEGHLVSDFVKNQIKEYFNNKKIYAINNKNKEFSFTKFGMSFEIYDKLKHNNYELIKNFYENTNKKLSDTEFDINFSGTTCIMVFKIGKKIICSNVGDSRAILVERKLIFEEKTNSILNKYEIIELSHDHKPNNKGEKERIEKCGGEVSQEFLNEEDEKSDLPFRVWKEGCNYIIMGSDGVFEYLTNNDILEISNKYLNNDNLQKACKIIVEKAATLFRQKENRVDDITINIINI
jgi:serine/threonine protein phosphatase PrpC